MRTAHISSAAFLFTALINAADYRVLATSKTSTMLKEMTEAAGAGFVFSQAMGGETANGGNEVLVVMEKSGEDSRRRDYKLLCTSKTSTMQKELNQAGDEGFEYRTQTIFESAFGGAEVCTIMERIAGEAAKKINYAVVATKKTSTMQRELQQAGEQGFRLVGTTVAKTSFGGTEVVSILRKTD